MKGFIRYCIRYFTHHTPIQIPKESSLIEPGKWYELKLFFKPTRDREVHFQDIRITRVPD